MILTLGMTYRKKYPTSAAVNVRDDLGTVLATLSYDVRNTLITRVTLCSFNTICYFTYTPNV